MYAVLAAALSWVTVGILGSAPASPCALRVPRGDEEQRQAAFDRVLLR